MKNLIPKCIIMKKMYNLKIWYHYIQLVHLGDQDALIQLARLTFYGINNVKQNLNL